jgi:dTDP-4-dehydrorhamnose 3,5-epimerase
VVVDLRIGSPTFAKWFGVELTAENKKQIFAPVGFAHGFVTLSELADVQYKCTGFYSPSAERTLAWDDPELGIEWPIKAPILSKRDSNGMSLRQYLDNPAFHHRIGA